MRTRAYILSLIVACAPTAVWGFNGNPSAGQKLSDQLLELVRSAPGDTTFDVLVVTGDASPETRRKASAAPNLKARYQSVSAFLHEKARRHQERLAASLAASIDGHSRLVKQFWIADMVRVQTDPAGLWNLAARNDVVRIVPNATVDLIEPVAASAAPRDVTGAGINLDVLGARSVWASGLTGKGRLVASIDTGVEGIHPALKNRWRGRHGDTAAAWYDPYGALSPVDGNGHGTHVMGIMVGQDGADTIGLAPGAEWITAAVIDRGSSLATTIADILAAFEWVADPDGNPQTTDDVPDVVCNSWGISQQIINPCDPVFFGAIDNLESLGIVAVFAAGNEGPNSMTIRNPADRAASPTSTFSVGAVDQTLAGFPVPSFSSRGPSACDGVSIKPEIVAPGVAIRSSYKGQSYRTINGTSMAAPHIAAAVAILRQENPDLTPEQIKTILLETARDIGDPGEDNESGYGLLDLPAAVAAAAPAPRPSISLTSYMFDSAGDAILSPGETVPLTITLSSDSAAASGLVGRIQALTPGVTVNMDSAWFGLLPLNKTGDNAATPFVVTAAPTLAVGDSLFFELSLEGDSLLGPWRDTIAVLCGLPEGSMVSTVDNGIMGLSLSNFGQLGVGPQSNLDAGGAGWVDDASGANALFEAALIVTSASGALSDATRGPDNHSKFDFQPVTPISAGTDIVGHSYVESTYDDSRATDPVGVSVEQRLTASTEPASSYMISRWTLTNRTEAGIGSIRYGLLIDIDLPFAGAGAERIVDDPVTGGFYYVTDAAFRVAGVVPLTGSFTAKRFYENAYGGKTALTSEQKLQALQPGANQPPAAFGDAFAIVAAPASDLALDGSTVFAVAFIMADSPDGFRLAAADARRQWNGITGVDGGEDGGALLPRAVLAQNFPNPFNPETVISFSLPRGGNVHLEVYNLLGQTMRTLVSEWMPAGEQSATWDGKDNNGQPVASGVYFYRLRTGNETITKKMVLLR